MRRIQDEWLAEFPNEPWAQIKGVGNRLRHEYFGIDDAILWEIVTADAPSLKAVMESMLERHANDSRARAPRLPTRPVGRDCSSQRRRNIQCSFRPVPLTTEPDSAQGIRGPRRSARGLSTEASSRASA